MSAPLRRLPNTVYGVASRCLGRRFRLVPQPWLRSLFGYFLALHARRHGIEVHGYCVLSNHYHLVVTDPHGLLGALMRDLNAALARCLNRRYGKRGRVFERYHAWELLSRDAILHQLVYVAANPVAAGLVRLPSQWPGLLSLPRHFRSRAAVPFEQPALGFDGGGWDPRYQRAEDLVLVPPRGWSRAQLAEEFAATLQAHLRELWAKQGLIAYPSRRELTRPRPDYAPPSEEDESLGPPAHLADATREERAGLIAWRRAYREAWQLWREGEREAAVFPKGTYLMRVQHRARVE